MHSMIFLQKFQSPFNNWFGIPWLVKLNLCHPSRFQWRTKHLQQNVGHIVKSSQKFQLIPARIFWGLANLERLTISSTFIIRQSSITAWIGSSWSFDHRKASSSLMGWEPSHEEPLWLQEQTSCSQWLGNSVKISIQFKDLWKFVTPYAICNFSNFWTLGESQ